MVTKNWPYLGLVYKFLGSGIRSFRWNENHGPWMALKVSDNQYTVGLTVATAGILVLPSRASLLNTSCVKKPSYHSRPTFCRCLDYFKYWFTVKILSLTHSAGNLWQDLLMQIDVQRCTRSIPLTCSCMTVMYRPSHLFIAKPAGLSYS